MSERTTDRQLCDLRQFAEKNRAPVSRRALRGGYERARRAARTCHQPARSAASSPASALSIPHA